MNYDPPTEEKGQKYKKEFPKLSIPNISFTKSNVIVGSILIIALSFAMNSYTKYQEQKQIEELTKEYTNMMKSTVNTLEKTQENIEKNFGQLNKNFHR